MHTPYSLIIVDMQSYFSAANGKKVQQSCVREIKKAIKDQATIMFVEYAGYGPTLPLLTNLVKKEKYKKVHRVLKYTDNGGKNISDYLRQKHLTRSNMRVCGVNTSYCVLATVQGINQHLKNSELRIVADACACQSGPGAHKRSLDHMRRMSHVKILREKV